MGDHPTGNTYEIRTINDFFQLTPRQREHAAKDLLLWVHYVNAAELASDFTDGAIRITTETNVFRWIDDGEHIATMNMRDHNGNMAGSFKRDHGDEMRGDDDQ